MWREKDYTVKKDGFRKEREDKQREHFDEKQEQV